MLGDPNVFPLRTVDLIAVPLWMMDAVDPVLLLNHDAAFSSIIVAALALVAQSRLGRLDRDRRERVAGVDLNCGLVRRDAHPFFWDPFESRSVERRKAREGNARDVGGREDELGRLIEVVEQEAVVHA